MTIQAAVSEKAYAGDGVSTVFAIPFPFDTSADLKLTSTDASGNITTLSTGFTISGGGGSTGNATFSVAPIVGVTITIYDNPVQTQPTNYVSLDAFPAESHEKALDRVTRITKRLSQLIERSARTDDGDPISGASARWPSLQNRKGKFWFWNATTGALEPAALVAGTISQSVIGQLLYPQTAGESSASVTPTNYFFPGGNVIGQGDVFRYGAKGDNSTDDSAAFLKAQQSNTTFSVPPATGYLTNTALTGQYSFIVQGNPAYSGTNKLLAWTPGFGGAFQCAAVSATAGGINAIVGMARNMLPASTTSFPTGVTAMGRNDNGGNTIFGLYAPAYQYATTGTVCGAEIDSFNMTAAPTNALPPSRGIGTSQNVPVALTVGAGGNFNSSIGIEIVREGSSPQSFLTGIYFDWTSCATYGIFIDALLQSTMTSAVVKHSTAQVALQVQGSGGIFGVAITGTAGQFSCGATTLVVGMQVTIAGALGGTGSITGYSNPTTYQISATNGSTTFTLQTLAAGALTTTAGTPTGLTYTAIVPTGAAISYFDANGVLQFQVSQQGFVNIAGNPVLKGRVSGYGTPTGNAYQPSFAAGAITLPNLAAAVAQLIIDLKTHGMIGT